MQLFKQKVVVGVSVSPERGLEAVQVDFETRTIQKYASKAIEYDNARKEIADLDIFKETLLELLSELALPKGSEIFLNLPTIFFKVADYPASLTTEQIGMAIEEELLEHPIFQNTDPCISQVKLPISTIQSSKVVYTVAQRPMLIEIAMQIKELGYKLIGIDTSVNSTLNALIYNERIDVYPDTNWIMLFVDNSYCRIISMVGRNYVDSYEEKISIGEVLGEEENYSTVVGAAQPILKNLPSKYLYIVSKTDLISAEKLAKKISYVAPIIHQEANIFSNEAFLNYSEFVDEEAAKYISLDAIGAAINREFHQFSNAPLNLYNASLGDIYLLEQPPEIVLFDKKYVLSLDNMLALSIVCAAIIFVVVLILALITGKQLSQREQKIKELDKDIAMINKFLEENKDISTSLFDEGDEIRIGLANNKNIYTYYTIVGTEIPQKLWLKSLWFDNRTIIEGRSENLESVYSFFRNIKDYDPNSGMKLQKLGLATRSGLNTLDNDGDLDTDLILTSLNADFYEFVIADSDDLHKGNETEEVEESDDKDNNKEKPKKKKGSAAKKAPELELID